MRRRRVAVRDERISKNHTRAPQSVLFTVGRPLNFRLQALFRDMHRDVVQVTVRVQFWTPSKTQTFSQFVNEIVHVYAGTDGKRYLFGVEQHTLLARRLVLHHKHNVLGVTLCTLPLRFCAQTSHIHLQLLPIPPELPDVLRAGVDVRVFQRLRFVVVHHHSARHPARQKLRQGLPRHCTNSRSKQRPPPVQPLNPPVPPTTKHALYRLLRPLSVSQFAVNVAPALLLRFLTGCCFRRRARVPTIVDRGFSSTVFAAGQACRALPESGRKYLSSFGSFSLHDSTTAP